MKLLPASEWPQAWRDLLAQQEAAQARERDWSRLVAELREFRQAHGLQALLQALAGAVDE